MRNLYPRQTLALLTLVVFVAQSSLVSRALKPQSAIDAYAITGARIVTLSGPVIERGTVVVRNGLISAVGDRVSAPADARVIDGTGLTVYPGLIDSHSSLGIPPSDSPAPARALSAGTIPPPAQPVWTEPNPAQAPGFQPEILAADLIQPNGDGLEEARNAGITAALAAPREGIMAGQSAFINLTGYTTKEMIVRSPVALHVGFTPLRTGNYPQSIMGVFSALRQMLLDAERLRRANQIYEGSPRGLRRPEQDRSLVALFPVITRAMPVVMYANSEREIRRALDLAEEFNLRVIIAGGAESWKVTTRLRERDVAVLLSLNFPKRTTAAASEADPDPLRVLRERVDAPKTAGRLAAARVRFAFQSGAMTNMADFLKAAAKAVEQGLARDEALRALTIRPAEILGVADRLGSIEVGKIANLTVTRGDLFDRNASIRYVFIDGQPVDLKPVTQETQAGAAGASGTWTFNVNLGEGEMAATLTLQQEGERLSGSIQGALGSGQISNGSAGASGDIRFSVAINVGGQTSEATFTGTINGNQMRGTVEIVGRAPGSFTGTRPGSAPNADSNRDGQDRQDLSRFEHHAGQPSQPSETLIRNATILTVSHGTLENSDILIRGGKIVAVGQNLRAGAGARVIDGSGKYVMPGIIDCHSHSMMDDINELTYAVTSMVRIRDVLNPTSPHLYRELAGGVTTLNLLHGSGNAIGGQNTVVKIKWGRPLEEFIFPGAPPGIKFALGENPKRSNWFPGQPRRYPATRMGVAETIRDAFTRARDYRKRWEEYRAGVARGEKSLIPPRRDLQLEPLVEVLEGKRFVHAHCYRADEILMLIKLADEFGFKVRTFQHVLEGYKVAKEIAQHGAAASTFADFWGYKMEAYDAIPYNAALMTRAGVNVSINSDSDERARRLNIDAAKMMKYGDLSEAEALKLITLNPAQQLGIQERVGSIDVGKDADLALWSGHPFSVYSRVETTFIDGEIFFDRQQEIARRAELA
ncbi:MAG: amidohydrolase family protein, partial [Pyrinomonadaceae bacterium]